MTLGEKAPWIVLVFWALTVAWLVLDARRVRATALVGVTVGAASGADPADGSAAGSAGAGTTVSETTVRVLGILAVVAAIFATTWIVLTGDAGSRSVWGHVAAGQAVVRAGHLG